MSAGEKKIAVILFNLGGPDSPQAVKPFLFNLFNDPAIIRVPRFPRWLIAKMISSRRAPVAREIYDRIGGKSPIVEQTRAQAEDLETLLNPAAAEHYKTFVVMRYWHPRADEVVKEVRRFAPDDIVLLPLYPQFSTTTSASSISEWISVANAAGMPVASRAICCYPTQPGWVSAQASLLEEALAGIGEENAVRVLFSAHGLPQKIVDAGDPYQWQVEQTVKAVLERLGRSGLDSRICYQSRVGPMKWIGPATDDEIAACGRDNKACIIVPIAFVSEHSETLVELDIEYRELAEHCGVPAYVRVPAVGCHEEFLTGLRDLVMASSSDKLVMSQNGGRLCPMAWPDCAFADKEG